MPSPCSELPDDIKRCHALIEQLRTELQAATEQNAKLQSAVAEARDTAAHIARDIARDTAAQIAHLEELLVRHQETIAEQEQTIEQLAADNALLKRSLFGSRRERFADDPAQKLLFDSTPIQRRWIRRSRTKRKSNRRNRRRRGPARDASHASFPTSCRARSNDSI